MIDTKMFPVTQINKSIAAAPSIAVYDAALIDPAVAFEDAEDYGLPQGSRTTFVFDSTSPEEVPVDFHFTFERGLSFTVHDDA